MGAYGIPAGDVATGCCCEAACFGIPLDAPTITITFSGITNCLCYAGNQKITSSLDQTITLHNTGSGTWQGTVSNGLTYEIYSVPSPECSGTSSSYTDDLVASFECSQIQYGGFEYGVVFQNLDVMSISSIPNQYVGPCPDPNTYNPVVGGVASITVP